MTDLQIKVIEAAKREMEKKSWFKGVCLDQMKHLTDSRITQMGFQNAVDELVIDTMAWDAW